MQPSTPVFRTRTKTAEQLPRAFLPHAQITQVFC